jgi:hypothetical protein
MPLPPGTLKALKGQYNAVVAVVAFAMATGAMAAGAPAWPVVAALAIALGMHHIRSSATERHHRELAERRVQESALKVEAIKARHRDLVMFEQPALPLERKPRTLAGDGPDRKGARR